MDHIVVSRVSVPRSLDPYKYDDPEPWRRVEILNRVLRPSLRQQTCQDFRLITLWGPFMGDHAGGELENEVREEIRRGVDEYDERPFDFEAYSRGVVVKEEMDFARQIRDVVLRYTDGPALITNVDSDDAVHRRFVELIQAAAEEYLDRAPHFLDVSERYAVREDGRGRGTKKRRTPSPFVSSVEPAGDVQCWPLRYHHSMLGRHLEGGGVSGLAGLQVIHGENIYSGSTGPSADFDVEDFIPGGLLR